MITFQISLSCNRVKKHIEYFDPEEKKIMFEGSKNSNGKLDGPFIVYKENGQIQEKGVYKDGFLDGEFYEYYKQDTILKCHLEFRHDKLWNVKEYYDEKYIPLDYGNFKNGTGLLIIYFPDGKIYQKGNYRNGLKEGKWEYYAWGDGKLMKTENYKEGIACGNEKPIPNPF